MKARGIKIGVIPDTSGTTSGENILPIPREIKMLNATPIALEMKFAKSIAFLARKYDSSDMMSNPFHYIHFILMRIIISTRFFEPDSHQLIIFETS